MIIFNLHDMTTPEVCGPDSGHVSKAVLGYSENSSKMESPGFPNKGDHIPGPD